MSNPYPLSPFREFARRSRFLKSAALARSQAQPEQRRSARTLMAGLYATCQPFGPEEMAARAGAVVDLSAEGVGMALAEPYPAGTIVGVELLDAMGEAACRVQARVVRTSQEASGRWHHGCEVLAEGS